MEPSVCDAVKRENSKGRRIRPYVLIWRNLTGWKWRRESHEAKASGGDSKKIADKNIFFFVGTSLVIIFIAVMAQRFYSGPLTLPSNGLIGKVRNFNYSKCESKGNSIRSNEMTSTMLLAAHHLLYAQLEGGNFVETYMWKNMTIIKGKHQEIGEHARALWTLVLTYQHVRRRERRYPAGFQTRLHEAISASLTFFHRHSKTTTSGARFVILPKAQGGTLDTAALLVLSISDLLHAMEGGKLPRGLGFDGIEEYASTPEAWRMKRSLSEYASFLLKLRNRDGRFVAGYEATGRPLAAVANDMSQGLALLALVRAAKVTASHNAWARACASAETLWNVHGQGQVQIAEGFWEYAPLAFLHIAGTGAACGRNGSSTALRAMVGAAKSATARAQRDAARRSRKSTGALIRSVAYWARLASAGSSDEIEDTSVCWAAAALRKWGMMQIGGPWAKKGEKLIGEVVYGYNPTQETGYVVNRTKCLRHVNISVLGSIEKRRNKLLMEQREQEAQDRPGAITIVAGQHMSLADMITRRQESSAKAKVKERPLSECERARDAHQRCNNDNPTGKVGFINCCRQLASLLFACMHNTHVLTLQQRGLFTPSYHHFCVPQGYVALPEGYDDPNPPVRMSEFVTSRERSEADGCDLAAIGGVQTRQRDGSLRIGETLDFLLTALVMDDHVSPHI